MTKNRQKKRSPAAGNYGVAEWYGHLYRALPNQESRLELLKADQKRECRFLTKFPSLAPNGKTTCNKPGGVCSIRNFSPPAILNDAPLMGPITATCPNRFIEDGEVLRAIGKSILGTDKPLLAKEIPFLRRARLPREEIVGLHEDAVPFDSDDEEERREDVGRIDLVCVHPDTTHLNWCAVEVQAVYFSGAGMAKDFAVIKAHSGDTIPMPGGPRRPDFRSSGPKRLMPQLQIKVPTLRRWGKKMAVVVDQPFYQSLGKMDCVEDISNADIAWVVVRFDERIGEPFAKLVIADIRYTTLERAVEGLTAGKPTTLKDFETKILKKIRPTIFT